MSIRVIEKVLKLAPAIVTPVERLVLYALAWHARDDGKNIFPAVGTISRETSLTKRAIQNILPRLAGKKLVYIQSRAARRSVRYGVALDALDHHKHVDDYEPRSQSDSPHYEPRSQSAASDGPDDCEPGSPHCEPGSGGGEPRSQSLRTGFTRSVRTVTEPSMKEEEGAPAARASSDDVGPPVRTATATTTESSSRDSSEQKPLPALSGADAFLAQFRELYRAHRAGAFYRVHRQDGKHVAELLELYGQDRLVEMARLLLTLDDGVDGWITSSDRSIAVLNHRATFLDERLQSSRHEDPDDGDGFAWTCRHCRELHRGTRDEWKRAVCLKPARAEPPEDPEREAIFKKYFG